MKRGDFFLNEKEHRCARLIWSSKIRFFLTTRASASVRSVLSLHPFLLCSRLCFAPRSRPIVASKTARPCQNPLCYYVAQLDVLVTIPIDERHCFTQRFSPTGFILNASHSNCCRPIALGSHSG